MRPVRPIALLLFSTLIPTLAAAQSSVRIDPEVTYEYGREITFRARIQAESPVVRAAVFFRRRGEARTQVLVARLEPVATGSVATATWPVDSAYLPPFSLVDFWWQVDLSDGSSLTTATQAIEYADNRFVWQSLQSGTVSVHWVEGPLDLGQATLDVAREASERLQREFFLPPPDQVRVYLYPSQAELQSALRLAGGPWVGGHAQPALGVVLLAIPPGPEARLEIERALPHELAHLMLYQRMGSSAYDNLPAWFNEGLATLMEASPNPDHRISLEAAAQTETFLPLASLCAAFPADTEQAMLAYAQSASLVQYIRDIYGTGALVALLDAYQEGVSCAGGIERVLRRPITTLEQEWRQAVTRDQQASILPLSPLLPWLLLLLPVLLVVLASLLPLRRPRRAEGRPIDPTP